ncbi:hypothetical protein LOTGIDRAFT_229738 [Lottia gigantea]|uniref:Tetratricopeptide repeat protein 5 OB fold domain-containing protein n=1 Tax=Lottia gigantea TaxID=225164 RepID=V4B2K3_LOTGI|nr:hypothetical protein LOTGIDRAFT_229738 [Lottia gigantea]ESO82669.1 hypothetical protein LOTGIDRAFT_229738 [Lottia gigantea]
MLPHLIMADKNLTNEEITSKTAAEWLLTAEETVSHLYSFRDNYIESHGVGKASDKIKDVQSKLEETMKYLDDISDKIKNKAVFSMLRGKTLNVSADFNQEAHDCLSKAVKLDPKQVEGWNQLGESFWKKGDMTGAKNCFSGALDHSKNKVSLRNLSMVMRQMPGTQEEKTKLIVESVEKAKEAVQLDIQDGISWSILGNAYLSMFFAAGQKPKILKQCMSAYQQAEKDSIANSTADLHHNRANAYKYQEDYQAALEGLTKASLLDPSWSEPKDREKQLIAYLTNVKQLKDSKGKVKGKKLETMIGQVNEKDLGPYNGGSYTGPKGDKVTLKPVKLKELKSDTNLESVIVGKVVCSVMSEDSVPFTFCMVDTEETCFPVTVYNIAPGRGMKIGDSVAIPEPYVQTVNVHHKELNIVYNSIRVDSPVLLVVNGKKLGIDKQAPTVLAVDKYHE